MKKIIILIFIIVSFLSVWFIFFREEKFDSEQILLSNTYNISKNYLALRYRTDYILIQTENYSNYEDWSKELSEIIDSWLKLEKDAEELERLAKSISKEKISFQFVTPALAYDRQEITNVFDNAPAGKKIATLAKHLGVDAKMAYKILKQDQAQVEADAWNEAGDTLQKLETSAVVIKDTCKVAGFVGGIVVTGGVSGLATGSVLSQAATIVSGADLILEVTEDGARIGLGNHNKISAIVGDVRKVTEPVASILGVVDLPNNLETGFKKFQGVMMGAEQFNSAAQEGKIAGIQLIPGEKIEKFSNIKKYQGPVYVSQLAKEEVNDWLKEVVPEEIVENEDLVKEILGIENNNKNVEEVETTSEVLVMTEDSESITSPEVLVKEVDDEGVINLSMKPEELGNDWQRAIRIELFSHAPIKIIDENFFVSYSTPFSFGEFSGFGEIKLDGHYDQSAGVISGRHYRKYDGTYKGQPKTLIYFGSFRQQFTLQDKEIKINFSGTVESTSLDGKGQPKTTTDEAGTSIFYEIN